MYGDIVEGPISPADISRVAGSVLLNRRSASTKGIIYLCGPQLVPLDELWATVSQVTGRQIVVVHPSPEAKVEELEGKGLPRSLASDVVKGMIQRQQTNSYSEPFYSEAVTNIKQNSGHEPTKFADYVAIRIFDIIAPAPQTE